MSPIFTIKKYYLILYSSVSDKMSNKRDVSEIIGDSVPANIPKTMGHVFQIKNFG